MNNLYFRGIMNDWYGSMEDLFQDLKHYGFEVRNPTVKASRYPATMMAIMFRSSWFLVETERTIVVEDFEEIYREEA